MRTFRQILEMTDDACRFTPGVVMSAPPKGISKSSALYRFKKKYHWIPRNGSKSIKVSEHIQQHLPSHVMPEYVPKSSDGILCPKCGRKELHFQEDSTGKIKEFCNHCDKALEK